MCCLNFLFSETANCKQVLMCELLIKCCFYSPSHQMHLFDIDVPGKIWFQESETLSPGCELAMFKTGSD